MEMAVPDVWWTPIIPQLKKIDNVPHCLIFNPATGEANS